MPSNSTPYTLYILKCADETLYTGVTTDLNRRVTEHNTDDVKGAKYTRTRRPVRVVYSKEYPDKSTAQKQEHMVKQMTRTEKLTLINSE